MDIRTTNHFKLNHRAQAAAAGFIALVALAAWMILLEYAQGGFGRDTEAMSEVAFEEATGVRLVFAARSAGGGMIDLRYQVLDPDKALVVHDDDQPPTLIDQASGRSLNRPQHDSHDHELRMGVTYHLLLANSGGLIKRDSLVTLEVGDARLEDIVVY